MYNPDNTLQKKTLLNVSNTVLNSWTYTYDAALHQLTQATPSQTTYYQYDSSNRLCDYSTTTAPPAPPNQCQNPTYAYDADGNRKTGPGLSFTYNADDSINTVNGGAAFSYTPYQAMQSDTSTSYSYDGLGRMTAAGSTTYQNDAFDRQRQVGSTAVHYDGFSPMPAIETAGTTDKIYALDPFGKPKAVQNAS